jgi:hypothetical protein
MDALRSHRIDFAFPQQLKTTISAWCKTVKTFLVSIQDTEETTPSSNGSMNATLRAFPSSFSGLSSFAAIESVLESVTVQLAVQLTTLLGHVSPQIRTRAVTLLFQLACLLDDKLVSQNKKIDHLACSIETNDQGEKCLKYP